MSLKTLLSMTKLWDTQQVVKELLLDNDIFLKF